MDSNQYLPEPIFKLINELNKLPTIGRKSAQRLAFYLLRQNPTSIDELASSIVGIKNKIKLCKNCFNLTEDFDECKICRNYSRNHRIICVVEEVLDLIAIEGTSEFSGIYHVLHGSLSPLDGVGPDKLKLKELADRVKNNEVDEVILATSTNVEGEATSLYVHEMLSPIGVKTTRIASGLPVGGDLDYADEGTLKRAMKGRMAF